MYEIYKGRILGFYQVFVSFASIFFQSTGCLLILDIAFSRAEFLNFNEVYLFFQGSCLLNVSKKLSPCPRSSRFSPRLSSRIFIVLYFIFRSLIHFGLIFVKFVKFVSRLIFFFFACEYLVVPTPFAKKTIFVPSYYLKAPFAEKTIFVPSYYLNSIKDQLTLFMWVYFWTFHSVSLICLHFANTALSS